MAHPTSIWAARLGLPDPAVPERDVLDADAAVLSRLAGICEAVARLADGAEHLVTMAAAVVREAWSAPVAVAAVEALGVQVRGVQATCHGAAGAIRAFAEGVPADQGAVRDAYAAADVTIVDQGLLPDPAPLPAEHFVAVLELRAYVVQQLGSSVAATAARRDAAALTLVSAIGPDPREGLVPPGQHGFATTAGRGAGDVDAANRSRLADDLSSSSPTNRAFAQSVQRALRHAAAGGNTVQLLSYDPTHPAGQGGVAIAVGDVAQADSVSVLVPGVENSPSDASGTLDLAADLNQAAEQAAPGTSAATVVYLAYDIPLSSSKDTADPRTGLSNLLGTVGDAELAINAWDALEGGTALAGFVGRLRGEMDPAAGLTLVGHSYGSTVVSEAAAVLGPGAGVNDIVLLASPGAGYGLGSADDYRAVPADHVYALEFPGDPVTSGVLDGAAQLVNSAMAVPTAGSAFGPDPAHGFGAQVIDAPSSAPLFHAPSLLRALTDPASAAIAITTPVGNLHQHAMTNYLSGAALAAVGAIAAGRYAQVPVKPRR